MKVTTLPVFFTSPYMRGPVVRAAQDNLKSNEYGVFLDGPADGVFGEETARATHRAKYWLGYGDNNIDKVFGATLMEYLAGTKPLPPENVERRKKRLAAKPPVPLREKAFKYAQGKLGVNEEPPYTNRVEFTRRWGMVGP